MSKSSSKRTAKQPPCHKVSAGGRVKPSTTKQALLLKLLRRPKGASIADLMGATGWQAHSVRAALSGLRKRDVVVLRETADDGSCYRIAKP